VRGKCDPSRGRDAPVDDPDDRDALPDCGGGGFSPRRLRDDARRRDRVASSTPGRGHTRHRSRRPGDSAGRSSDEGVCPTALEQRGSAPAGRTAQPVAQQTGQPRCVGARGRHEGPEDQSGPSPSVCPAYAITFPHTNGEEAWTVWKPAQNAASHTAHSPCLFSAEETRKESKARASWRAPSRFPRSHVTANNITVRRFSCR